MILRQSGCSLAILAGFVLVGSSCRVRQDTALVIDPALEKLIPSGTTVLTGANIEALRALPIFQRYVSAIPELSNFVQETGLDPRQNLQQILGCSNGRTEVLLVRGELQSALTKKGLSDYKGYKMYSDDRQAVLFFNSSIAIAGAPAEVEAIVNARDRSAEGLSPALQAAVARISADRQIWAAFVGAVIGPSLGIPERSNLGQGLHLLRGIEQGSLGVDLRDGIDFRADLVCRNQNDARHVHDGVLGIVGIASLMAPKNRPDLTPIYESIKVTEDQTKVTVTAQIPAALADSFLAVWFGK